jgi:hypothetical protein
MECRLSAALDAGKLAADAARGLRTILKVTKLDELD